MIVKYNISYIVLEQLGMNVYRDSFIMDLYQKNQIGDYLLVDKKVLTLIYVAEGAKFDLLVYRINNTER